MKLVEYPMIFYHLIISREDLKNPRIFGAYLVIWTCVTQHRRKTVIVIQGEEYKTGKVTYSATQLLNTSRDSALLLWDIMER